MEETGTLADTSILVCSISAYLAKGLLLILILEIDLGFLFQNLLLFYFSLGKKYLLRYIQYHFQEGRY